MSTQMSMESLYFASSMLIQSRKTNVANDLCQKLWTVQIQYVWYIYIYISVLLLLKLLLMMFVSFWSPPPSLSHKDHFHLVT